MLLAHQAAEPKGRKSGNFKLKKNWRTAVFCVITDVLEQPIGPVFQGSVFEH
jgi:hypothetical protein